MEKLNHVENTDPTFFNELFLALNYSNDINSTIKDFITPLLQSNYFINSFLWIKEKKTQYTGNEFSFIHSSQEFKDNQEFLSELLNYITKDKEYLLIDNSKIYAKAHTNSAPLLVFRDTNFSIMALVINSNTVELTETFISQLNIVVKKFFNILKISSNYSNLLERVKQRDLIDNEMANLSKFANENPNPILRVLNDGKLLFANNASKPIIKFLEIDVNDYLPNELVINIKNALLTKTIIPFEFKCKELIFLFKYVPIQEENYVNIYATDITAEKSVKEEISNLKQFYEQTLDDLPGQIAVFDSKLRYLYVNKLSIKDDELRKWIIGKTDYEYCKYRNRPITIADKRTEKLKSVLKAKTPNSFEEEIKTNTAEYKYFLRFISPVLFANEVKYILAYGIEITDRKLVEQTLNESSARIEAIVNNAVEAIITIDENGIIDSFNPQAEKIFGYISSEVLGKNVKLLMPSPHNINHHEYIKNYVKTGEKKIIGIGREVEGIRKDGSKVPLELSVSEVNINNKRLFTGIIRDITERKVYEEELLETNSQNVRYAKELQKTIKELKHSQNELANSEKQLSAVLTTVGEGIITIDCSSNIVMANEEVEKIWGYSKEELIGHPLTTLMPKKFRDGHMAGMKRYISTGTAKVLGKKLELEGERKGGQLFPIEITIKETVIDNQQYFTAAVHDITERNNLIQKLQRSNDALSEFAYIASHDLREPLRKISSFGSILEKTLQNKLDADDKENLEFMIDGAKRMQQMIDDLLSYSRLTSQIISLQEIDVERLIKRMLKFELSKLIEETKAQVTIINRLGIIKGEETQIVQLFQNLITNAIKYRQQDVVPEILISSEKIGNMIRINIKDNGIGIDEAYHSQIFDMFKRLHDRSTYTGSGIGLSICKKIVENHGGEIGVKSEINQGSRFWATFMNGEDYFGDEFK